MQHLPQADQTPSSFTVKWGEWILKRRWLVLLGTITLGLAIGMGGQFLGFNTDYRAFFGADNPQLQAFTALQEKYSKDDNVFIVISPEDGDVFTPQTLAAIEKLTQEAWQTPYSTRVDAITNFQHTKAEGDDLFVEDLVEGSLEKSPTELAAIKEIAINEPLLVNRLVNKDGSITAVNITVRVPGEKLTENDEITSFVRNMVQTFETENPELKTYASGMVMLNNAFQETSQGDMATLIPIMFLVIIIAIWLATRSVGATLTTLLVIILSIMTAMGFAGWMGIKLTPPSAAAPTIIMTLAIADSIHILISMIQNMQKGMAKRAAILESLRLNYMPVFITSITTVIGFLTMNFSDTPPFHDLGNITAVGMLGAFLFSVTTLPALMSILPIRVKASTSAEGVSNVWIDRMADFVIRNNRPLLWGSTFAIIGISLLSLRNELNDEFVNYFSKNVAFRTDTDFISDNLTGIYNLEFSLGAGESGGINNPEYLQKLDEFENWLYEQPEVVHVNTFSEITRRINKSMHGDDPNYYTIPNNREEAAQYLLLYEMSLPFGLDLNNQVNVDKSETRFTITTTNLSSNNMIAFSEKAEGWLKGNAPEHMFTHGTSSASMFSHLSRRQINSMMSGTAFAIVLISIILILALGSFKYGLLSLIPNLTPVTVGFGIWAVSSGMINSGIAIVFGMTLGIIVDDTVHFISKYLRARREQNKSPEEAVRYAFQTVGKALIATSLVLTAGFMVLAQSDFGMNSGMALVSTIIIIVALVIDFLLLPGLLIAVGSRKTTIQKEATPELVKA
ncbi:MAG: efflux RND transporter permease subunit [Bacteroidota bacterium]